MRLPNAEKVVIDEHKVRDYLLSKSHPVGRFKAAFFASLGFDPDGADEFVAQLREIAGQDNAEPGGASEYGDKYLISGILTGPGGRSAGVVTVWIIHLGDDKPRLVTVYPE